MKIYGILCGKLSGFQGDSADLVSLREICLGGTDTTAGTGVVSDLETEQLLSEIELLTSRALQETNQAGTNAARKNNDI